MLAEEAGNERRISGPQEVVSSWFYSLVPLASSGYLGPVPTIMQRNILHGNWGPVRAIIQGIHREDAGSG